MILQVLVPLAHGFEEIEATCPIDLLRRAEVEVITASCEEDLTVIGRSGIPVRADRFLADLSAEKFEMLVLPGGPAVFEMRKKPVFIELIKSFDSQDKPIGAICAAPVLLHDAGLLENTSFTAHSTVVDELEMMRDDQAVVIDGRFITSRGAGTAVEFGLALVNYLCGEVKASQIRKSIHA
jgi:4-methyl-5(b-hydroxyethyl)-thiazole monophosphate biosynthesis